MTKDEALLLALEALNTAHLAVEDDMLADEIEQAITAIREAMVEQPEPPPECKTDAEKTAFAFGWWKALEENRKQPAQQEGVSWERYMSVEKELQDMTAEFMRVAKELAALKTQQQEPPCKTGGQCTSKCQQCEQPAQQERSVAWVDAGDLKQLRDGDVIRVIRNEEVYYSPFRYCGVLEECDYAYYRENSQFVYLEVGMATVEKIVYTRKDFATGAVYADRGDRVEIASAIEAKLREKNDAN